MLYESVAQGGIYLLVAQKPLDLFDGHALVDRNGCERSPETVRVAFVDITLNAHSFEHYLDGAGLKSDRWVA